LLEFRIENEEERLSAPVQNLYGMGHAFQDLSVIYCRSSGIVNKAKVSLGTESVRLKSRHGDSHF
jgi:hypothetical protein